MDDTTTIPLPRTINEHTPDDIRGGVLLFYRVLAEKIQIGIDADLDGNPEKLRELFANFITVYHMRRERPKHVNYDSFESELELLDNKVSAVLDKLGV